MTTLIEQINNNKLFTNNLKNCKAGIIPHAGKQYSGICRYNCFIYFNRNTKYIIYIAALHNFSPKNTTYILYNTIKKFKHIIKYTYKTVTFSDLDEYSIEEHSFKWVKKELESYFPNSEILVLAPTIKVNIIDLSNCIINLYNILEGKKIIFGTTDLTHYGDRFNNIDLLKYPIQLNKMKLEENFIYDLCNIKKPNLFFKNNYNFCGKQCLKVFYQICKKLNFTGRVVDYYDSFNINKNIIDKYTIDLENNINNLVSYCSIVYSKNKNISILPIDILLGIGLCKNIINISTKKIKLNDNLILPKWCYLNKLKNGIFVGTELNTQTNCSYGNYQSDKNITQNIINASKNCYNDAKNRWKIPYTLNNIIKMNYKLEILDLKKNWKIYDAKNLINLYKKKKFKLDGKTGVYLKLYNGKSATYLPTVSLQFNDNFNNYISSLSRKAGGRNNDWKKSGSKVKLYNSISYKYIYPGTFEII